MTLGDLIPSLRGSLGTRLADGLWPTGAHLDETGELWLGGVRATELAARFATPTYVLDEAEVRGNCRRYRAALPDVEICYAGKALLTRAVARWMREEGLSLDVCSAGELAMATRGGFPAERITLHGNAKTSEDLKAALHHGVGRIVLDAPDEIERLGALAPARQRVLIRVTPEVDAHTHRAISTGVADQKFGFLPTMLTDAVGRVLAQPSLVLVGLHCHLGSQIGRAGDFEAAARRMVELRALLRDELGIVVPELNLGGGQAVRYLAGDPEFDLVGYARRLRVAVNYESQRRRLPPPRLTIEPGRSLVARAGVTLYRVVSVKQLPGVRTFVGVDGGMSDNLRPALYGARYTVRLVGRYSAAPRRPVTVVGRHCEAGDVLATDVELPADLRAGDLLAMPGTGAYHHALASNYNLVTRPPIVAVGNGSAHLLVRRETEEDLLARDVGAGTG